FYYLLMTKYRKHDVFFISVPPMAYLLNLVLPHRFSMLIWDVYPDSLKITGMKESHPVYKFWSRLNRRSFKKAFAIITIGDKMADLLSKYVNREKLIIQPIWSIFQGNDKIKKSDNPFIKEQQLEGKFVVQYSGNIGLTHNVEVLINIASAMKDYEHIVFQIIGRGPRKKQLEQRVRDEKIPNCRFLPFQSDAMFPYSLSAADLGVVILDETTSKGSVPSKSYNLMSYGIPSLYIASGDSELFEYALKYRHAECFGKNDMREIIKYISDLAQDKVLYNNYAKNALKASEHFRRDNAGKIVAKYVNLPLD
ncbi:MAG: glycosyltransferase family 4 protein, partial [Flavobacteriaceae bacterium]|nr:glycosyltransferase family 4 protein [Flavobacteriaceae bacterium]